MADKKDQSASHHNEEHKESGKEGAAAKNASQAVTNAFDTVSGLLEGIAQFIRERPVWQTIALAILGIIGTKVAISTLKDFLNKDPRAAEIKAEERRRIMAELELNGEKFFDKCKEVFLATFGKAYTHLKSVELMTDAEFKEFITQLEAQRAGYKLRRCQSLSRRKLVVRIGVSLMVYIILCGALPPEQRGWIFGLGIALAVIVFLVAVAIQNNRRPALPIGILQPQQPIGE